MGYFCRLKKFKKRNGMRTMTLNCLNPSQPSPMQTTSRQNLWTSISRQVCCCHVAKTWYERRLLVGRTEGTVIHSACGTQIRSWTPGSTRLNFQTVRLRLIPRM
jgi:hypothetical protein